MPGTSPVSRVRLSTPSEPRRPRVAVRIAMNSVLASRARTRDGGTCVTPSASLKVASWAERSEHTGHDPPPHPGCIPRIDRVLSQCLLLVGRPDEKRDIRGC